MRKIRPIGNAHPRPPRRLRRHDERKVGEQALKFIRMVEEVLPGATGPEKKAWVIRKLDGLIALPQPWELISDIILSVVVEVVYHLVHKPSATE